MANSKAGPNDTVRMAVCGVNGRGKEHIAGWSKLKDVRIASICDVDLRSGQGRDGRTKVRPSAHCRPGHPPGPRRQVDRRHLDRHAEPLALPGGHLGLPGRQGRLRRKAGQPQRQRRPANGRGRAKYERIVQAGTQCRSNKGIQDAIEFIRSGKLGQIYMAKGLCYKPRGSIGHKPDAVPPGSITTSGSARRPVRPFNPNRFHYKWHWNWDYGNGDLGNQGIHQMDLARWGMGKNEFPGRCISSGGRYGYSDDGQTPNTLHVAFEFDDCELQFEVRGL